MNLEQPQQRPVWTTVTTSHSAQFGVRYDLIHRQPNTINNDNSSNSNKNNNNNNNNNNATRQQQSEAAAAAAAVIVLHTTLVLLCKSIYSYIW